jgi:hypothetical protein
MTRPKEAKEDADNEEIQTAKARILTPAKIVGHRRPRRGVVLLRETEIWTDKSGGAGPRAG